MALSDDLISNFNAFMNTFGREFHIYNRTATYDSYDQEVFSVTGSSSGSCLILPVSEARNGEDFQYLEQGLVKREDLKIFLPSGYVIDENDIFACNTGSYEILRIFPYWIQEDMIYRKLYIRSSGV